jgi:CBS domain containing-hemolysin-like protein
MNITIFIGQIIALIVFIGLAAFFSIAETAFVSLGSYHFKKLRERDTGKAKKLEFWFRYPNRVLTTVLVCTIIVDTLASVTAASIAYRSSGRVNLAIMTAIVTFGLLIFGEIIPKSFAKRYAEQAVLHIIAPIRIITQVFEPLNRFLLAVAEGILSVFRLELGSILPVLTEEDIKAMISAGEEEGLIEEEEREMIHSIFSLGSRSVSEIMISRVNMSAVEAGMPAGEILKKVVREGFSRYPVYEGNFDKIIGIVYLKDIIAHKQDSDREPTAREIMRQAYFVPETKKISELMWELQRMRLQMAIVVDEYGGTAGIVTMEDLVEEIVGEISDEYKEETGDFQRLGDGSVLVRGAMEIEKANEELDLHIEKGSYETLAGFVLSYLGKLPMKGEKFIYERNVFTVHEVKEKTIVWVRIKPLLEERKDE